MKKLEELFQLPTDEENTELTPTEDIKPDNLPEEIISVSSLSSIEKIESALPSVRGLEASDSEMDELAKLAKASYKDLMDLGMNVEAKHASEIFHSAGTMLGHAITAKTAKVNKKLKMIELQLKKARLDQTGVDQFPTEEGTILDRNELLERLINGKGDAS